MRSWEAEDNAQAQWRSEHENVPTTKLHRRQWTESKAQTERDTQTVEDFSTRAARLQRVIEARGPMEDTIFPIPLRGGSITVRIQGLPHDLTEGEANRIAGVILAYARHQE